MSFLSRIEVAGGGRPKRGPRRSSWLRGVLFSHKQTNFSDILVFLSSSMAFSHLSHRGYYARSSKIPQARHIL